MVALTPEEGNHSAQYTYDYRYLLDTYSKVDAAPAFTLPPDGSAGSMIVNMFGADNSSNRTINFSVTDPHGGVFNGSFGVTIKGTNDRPELELLGGDDHRLVISTGTTPDGNATTHATITMTEDDKSFSVKGSYRLYVLCGLFSYPKKI